MAVEDQHPQYVTAKQGWQIIQDAIVGEEKIKQKTVMYLPKTAGQIEAEKQGAYGKNVYNGYLLRAQYPLWVQDTLRSMIGLVSKLNPDIQLKSPLMQKLLDNATNDGFGLKQLFVRVVLQVLEYGRCGLLTDIDENGKPYFALYDALSVTNWKENNVGGRKDLNLVVLQEQFSANADEFSHETKTVYRVLSLHDGALSVRVFDGGNIEDRAPSIQGKPLQYIPFVFCGATDNCPDVGSIPLLTMAKSAIKYYQLSADYFQSLHHTAHPQPWIAGINDEDEIGITGVMAVWQLPQDAECGYLEVTGNGIEKIKTEMDAQKNAALEAGAKVIDTNTQESGEARRARQDDQHASLHSIVLQASEAIEQSLKYAAEWLGFDPEDYVFSVKPEFSATGIDMAVAKQLYESALAGKTSIQTYWEYLETGKLPERSYEDELLLVESEQVNAPMGYTGINNGTGQSE